MAANAKSEEVREQFLLMAADWERLHGPSPDQDGEDPSPPTSESLAPKPSRGVLAQALSVICSPFQRAQPRRKDDNG